MDGPFPSCLWLQRCAVLTRNTLPVILKSHVCTTFTVPIAFQCRVIHCAVLVKCSLRLSVSVKVSSMHSWTIFRYVHCYSYTPIHSCTISQSVNHLFSYARKARRSTVKSHLGYFKLYVVLYLMYARIEDKSNHLSVPIFAVSLYYYYSFFSTHCICKSLFWPSPHLPQPFLLPSKHTFQTLRHVIAPYPIYSIHTLNYPSS